MLMVDRALENKGSKATAADKETHRVRKAELTAAMDENGGVERYQQASVVSTEHFKTSRFVVRTLQELAVIPTKGGRRLATLETGAINVQLQACPFLNVRAIDINSQHAKIEELNFFDLEDSTMFTFDVVVSSMVVNCVQCPYKRFEMLCRLVLQLTPTGKLFLMLPVRCVDSKHLRGNFVPLLKALGLKECVEHHRTPKIAFYVLSRSPPGDTITAAAAPAATAAAAVTPLDGVAFNRQGCTGAHLVQKLMDQVRSA
jgi:25S rRNA (adenine2142-N1)-methyltransferase